MRDAWNLAGASVFVDNKFYRVHFAVRGYYSTTPLHWITGNKDYKKVFMRVEDHTDDPNGMQISYMDEIGANSGLFLIQNVMGKGSTTEAHELGYGWGRIHDLGGSGQPGIMWPRGANTDSIFRYDPGSPISTLNPEKRRVSGNDVARLGFSTLRYDAQGRAFLGKLTNRYHSFK